MGNTQIIELNGRKYDAQTGREIKENTKPATSSHIQKGTSVDGFVTAKSHALRNVAGVRKVRKPKRAQTLMRTAVKKPKFEQSPNSSAQPVLKHAQPTVRKFSTPENRVHRAKQTQQSSHIKRFGDIAPSVQHAVENAAESTSKALHDAAENVSKQAHELAHMGHTAVEHALSHTQQKPKKKRAHHKLAEKLQIKARTVSTVAAVAAFVLLGGFFTYQNAPNLSMSVASMRSDVDGSLPGYLPSGYSLNGPIRYEPGKIVFEYKSNTDNRGFAVTETKSAWDTESLRQNFVEPMGETYQTVQSKGKTVYLYSDANATWVDGGVWYKVEGDSKLSSEQLNKLINSL